MVALGMREVCGGGLHGGRTLCLGAPCPLEQIRRLALELGAKRRDDIRAALRREAEALNLAKRHERRGMWRRIAEQASGAEGLSALERL